MREISSGQRRASAGRRGLTRALSATAVAAVASVALFGAVPATAAGENVDIDVYTMNDFHGRIEATAGSSVSGSTAGAASIATAYKEFLTANPNSTLVSAGDNVGASTFTSLVQNDNPTIDALNAMGLTASTIGNHELDYGRDDLDDRIIPRADYDLISSNLFEKGTHDHAYSPYSIQEFEGVKVGFIGAITEALPTLVSPDGIATLDVAPIVSSVNEVASELTDGDAANGEADVLMLVIHEGAGSASDDFTDASTTFGAIVDGVGPNVDAIVSGHTHVAYNQEVTIDGRTIPVLQTGSYGTFLGHISLSVDSETKEITAISSELVDLLEPTEVTNPSTGVVSTVYTPIYEEDPTVAKIVSDAVDVANVEGNVSIGSITADVKRGVQTDGSENRGAESTIGNLVADAQLWATQADLGTQIAFMNPGGIRQNITYASTGTADPDGNVTYKEAAVVQPFANTLITETLTGAQITEVLEQQWQPTGTRPALHLGVSAGLTYTYDPTAEQGSHITEVFFEGEPITDDETFKVVTNSFLAAGGDGFTALGAGADKADSGRVDLVAFTDYMKAFSPVSPDAATRSIGIVDTTPTDAALEPGSTVSYDLSSLIVNNSSVFDTEVVATLDGVEVARSDIDPTIVDLFDEQGRASVSFAVPETTTTGDHVLEFSLPTTGVTLSYTLSVENGYVVPTPEPTETATPTPAPTETTVPTSPAPTGAPGAGPGDGDLASTGVDTTSTIFAGVIALLLGAVLIVARRRREHAAE